MVTRWSSLNNPFPLLLNVPQITKTRAIYDNIKQYKKHINIIRLWDMTIKTIYYDYIYTHITKQY